MKVFCRGVRENDSALFVASRAVFRENDSALFVASRVEIPAPLHAYARLNDRLIHSVPITGASVGARAIRRISNAGGFPLRAF